MEGLFTRQVAKKNRRNALVGAYLLASLWPLLAVKTMALRPKVAVVIFGLQRSFCTLEYVNNVKLRVLRPLLQNGFAADLFVNLAVEEGTFHTTGRNCSFALRALSPRALTFRTAGDDLVVNEKCETLSPEALRVFQQFYAGQRAFQQVLAYAAFKGTNYSHVLKIRTDTFFFTDIPKLFFSATMALVPYGGMTPDRSCEFLNDHVFSCPMALCKPYFSNVEEYVNCRGQLTLPGSHDPRFALIPQIAMFAGYTVGVNLSSFADLAYTLTRVCHCGAYLECERLMQYTPSFASSYFGKCVEEVRRWSREQRCDCGLEHLTETAPKKKRIFGIF